MPGRPGDELPSAAVVVARDVTEQRLAQAALAEVEVRLEEGEALAHVGSWLWDVRTGTVQWSPEFHRIHGVDPLTSMARSSPIWVGSIPRTASGSGPRWSVRWRRAGPFNDEYRIVRPDGEIRVLRVRAQPTVGSAGTAVGLRGIGQDVTERTEVAAAVVTDQIPDPGDQVAAGVRGRDGSPSTTEASSRRV